MEPGYRGFLAFADLVGLALEPFQLKIARAALESRELVVLLARGNGKSRLIGTLAVHHLLTTPKPAVYLAAASRDQARVVFEYARDVAMHPELLARITVRHLELRVDDGFLRVLASDARKLFGLTPSLAITDEMQAFKDDSVYLALRTAVHKRPGAQMWTISTAGQGADSALGKLRARALSQADVRARGALVEARGPSLTMLEWATPEGRSLGDVKAAKMGNPASWLTPQSLRDQREAVPEPAFRQYHLNQWVERTGSWLPAGSWHRCAGEPVIDGGERVWLGLDVGGTRASTALVAVTGDLRVNCWIFEGEDAILDVAALVSELAEKFVIVELVYDPWRAHQLALEFEQRRIRTVKFPQSDSRMVPASQALYDAIVEKRLTHPNDPALNRHIAAAVAQGGRRGWRLAQAPGGGNVDAAVALAMAVERASVPVSEARLVGWL